jgi:hypothetical protein
VAGPLNCPYFAQHDNHGGDGWRECFTSSVAMLLAHIGKVRTDDDYNRIRRAFGDTTTSLTHIRAVRSLGLIPTFRTDFDRELLEASIRAGRPVAVGWLHRGTPEKPTGGGHWSVVIASSASHLLIHDPAGEPDLVNGGHIRGRSGRAVKCTWRNWGSRWQPEGPGHGYAFTVRSA